MQPLGKGVVGILMGVTCCFNLCFKTFSRNRVRPAGVGSSGSGVVLSQSAKVSPTMIKIAKNVSRIFHQLFFYHFFSKNYRLWRVRWDFYVGHCLLSIFFFEGQLFLQTRAKKNELTNFLSVLTSQRDSTGKSRQIVCGGRKKSERTQVDRRVRGFPGTESELVTQCDRQ